MEVAFAINGRLAPDHEMAFAKAGGPQRLGMDAKPPSLSLKDFGIDKASAQELPDPKVDQELRMAVAAAQETVFTVSEAVNAASQPAQLQQARTELRQAEHNLQHAQEAREAHAATFLRVYDHPVYLEEALTRARERLLIISPWITASIVNDDFRRKLAKLSQAGVQIYIGYGITDDGQRRKNPRDEVAERDLLRLASTLENLKVKKLGDTHAKVLAYDRKWVVVGSFNWLSYKGDRNRPYRDEQSILLRMPSMVDRKFAECLSSFARDE